MYDFYEEVATIVKKGRELVSACCNDAYELLKCWPSLIIACILKDLEGKTILYNTLQDSLVKIHYSPFYQHITKRGVQ